MTYIHIPVGRPNRATAFCEEAEPVLVDRSSGRPLVAPDFHSAAGPAADARTRRRYGFVAREQAKATERTSDK